MNQFNTNQKNLNLLIEAVDFSNSITNDFAVRIASKYPGAKDVKQICYIFDYINANWKYVLDSQKQEFFRSASRTINNNFSGDCDDYAILMAALLESIGFSTRISFAFNNELGGHAFTEVLVANNVEGSSQMQNIVNWINEYYNSNQLYINWNKDNDNNFWLNLDWWGDFKYPGGSYYQWQYKTIYYPTLESPYFIQEENIETVNSSDNEVGIKNEINLPTLDTIYEAFNPIISKHSIFIGNDIPEKKYNNFINQFNLEYFKQSINLVYYDSTLFGKGDNGFFIINNYSNIYFFYSSLEGLILSVSLYDDNVNGYITEYRFEPNQGVVLTLKFPNTNLTYYSLGMNEEVALILVRFFDVVCGNLN